MLTEIKKDFQHYFENENCEVYGEYKDYHANGKLQTHVAYMVDSHVLGEFKSFGNNGNLLKHGFYSLEKLIHDQLENPLSEEELLLLCLEHGFKRLPPISETIWKECGGAS